MKPIKFRVWNPKNKRLLTWDEMEKDGDYMASWHDGELYVSYHWAGGERGESQESCWCVIQQFTGLKDKNGREIYEGDIMASRGNYITNETDENGKYPDLINVVVWNTKATRFGLKPLKEYPKYKDGEFDDVWTCYLSAFKEVIGNIYENKQ